RKVAGLPPVSSASFSERALAQQQQQQEEAAKSSAEKRANLSCNACQKKFCTENAFNNHLKSKKHRELENLLVIRMQEMANRQALGMARVDMVDRQQQDDEEEGARPLDSDDEGEGEDTRSIAADSEATKLGEEETERASIVTDGMEVEGDISQVLDRRSRNSYRAQIERRINMELNKAQSEEQVVELVEEKRKRVPRLELEECLFCSHMSESLDGNVQHMFKAHSFFIPDVEYLVDLAGLIRYLGDKLRVANVCLYCNGRGRGLQSLEAVRKHMIDKGHCKLAYDTEIDILELADFYDFSSSYADADGHSPDDEVEMAGGARLAEDEMELVLPSGVRIGHRSLHRYYRQHLRPENEKESVTIHKLLTDYSANAEVSTQLQIAHRNRAVILAQPKGKQAWKDMVTFRETRVRQNFESRIGERNNRLMRTFRADNPI
ncbi:pre-60S factor rei1, partial [Spiromyces aspiralis]